MPISPPGSGCFLGVYAADPLSGADATPTKIQGFEDLVQSPVKVCLNYRGFWEGNWPYSDPSRYEGWMVAHGKYPMITMGSGGTRPKIPDIASGKHDSVLRSIAGRVKNFGDPLFIRPYWEFTGDYSSYCASRYNKNPDLFITAWKRTVDIFNNQGATNVTWVWCPGAVPKPNESWNQWQRYYPGDGYVDWIAADSYNREPNRWRQLGEKFDKWYEAMKGQGKPMALAETASVEGTSGQKAAWIANGEAWVKARPEIKCLTWFQRGPNPVEPNTDWRVQTSTGSLAAYRNLAAEGYFQP